MFDDPGRIMFMVVIGAAMLFFVWIAARVERRRTDALAEVARTLGLRFRADRDYDHDSRYSHFEVFRQGRDRYAHNTMQGVCDMHGCPCHVLMGDFHYEIRSGSGKNRSTRSYRFSYAIVHLPYRGAADVLIRPEGVLDRMAAAIGFSDINFESAAFSRAFYVKSSDRRFAYDLIDAAMMEYLLRTRPPLIDMERDRILLTNGRTRWRPEEFAGQLEWIRQFINLWPRHLVDRLQRRHS